MQQCNTPAKGYCHRVCLRVVVCDLVSIVWLTRCSRIHSPATTIKQFMWKRASEPNNGLVLEKIFGALVVCSKIETVSQWRLNMNQFHTFAYELGC